MSLLSQNSARLLVALFLISAAHFVSAEDIKPEPKPIDRLTDLEKRVQLLERALIEKDAQISDLRKKVETLSQMPQGENPGMQFRLNPEDMARFQRNIEEYMRQQLDQPFFDQPDGDPFGGRMEPNDPWAAPRALEQRKPRLGVGLQDASAELNEKYGNNNAAAGAYVMEVVAGSVADKAGLKVGDLVQKFNVRDVRSAADLTDQVRSAPEGDNRLTVLRHDKELDLKVTFERAAGAPRGQDRGWVRRDGPNARQGMKEQVEIRTSAFELSPPLEKAMQLDEKSKAKVAEVFAKHAKALNQDFVAHEGKRNDNALVKDLIDKHAAAAEAELKDSLSEAQLKAWREFREANQMISFTRQLQIEEQPKVETQPERPNERF